MTELNTAVIVDAVRTPSGKGKPGGALSDVHPIDLLAGTLEALLERTGLDPALVEDVIAGCAQQVGEQSGNIARHASLAAGLPEAVPATTINRQCGSSQQAAAFAAQGVIAGSYDVVIAAGVESMSVVPLGSSRPASTGRRNAARYGLVHQGISAELIAARWKLDRDELDAYSAESHRRAAATAAAGGYHGGRARGAAALVPDRGDGGQVPRDRLEDHPGQLLAADRRRLRRPDHERGRGPQARDAAASQVRAFSVVGDDPLLMLTGPIPATRKVLARAGLSLEDIDAYEVNEAFAPVPLAWAAEFGADPAQLNPRGGAIALGHPLGSSGTRLLTTSLSHLEQTGGRYGLQTMCEAGGMANATILECL